MTSDDAYTHGFTSKDIIGWAFGAYNPTHEQIELQTASTDITPTLLGILFGAGLLLMGIAMLPVWDAPR